MNPDVPARDPVERWAPLMLKMMLYVLLACVFYQAATCFRAYVPLQRWPLALSTIRTFIFLPIHEAGHFLFAPFGRTLYIVGGSFWQVALMVLWFAVAMRQRSQTAPVAAFFAGENLMDVSLYVRDAQYMALPLLGGDSGGHDWRNLLTSWNALDSAGTLAGILYFSGWIICACSLLAGIALSAVVFFRQPPPSSPPGKAAGNQPDIGDLLDRRISQQEDREPLE